MIRPRSMRPMVEVAVAAAIAASAGAALASDWPGPVAGNAAPHPYAAVLPVLSGALVTGALVIVGEARDPFAALDEDLEDWLSEEFDYERSS